MREDITVRDMAAPNSYYETDRRAPELSAKPVDKRPIIWGIIAAIIIVFIFGGLGVWLFLNPAAAAVLRDIFIIFLGLGAFIVILLLIALVVVTVYLVLKINDLTQLLSREIRPVLGNIAQTTHSVRGTATFISEQAVQPIIKTAGFLAAIQAIFNSLFRRR